MKSGITPILAEDITIKLMVLLYRFDLGLVTYRQIEAYVYRRMNKNDR